MLLSVWTPVQRKMNMLITHTLEDSTAILNI